MEKIQHSIVVYKISHMINHPMQRSHAGRSKHTWQFLAIAERINPGRDAAVQGVATKKALHVEKPSSATAATTCLVANIMITRTILL